MSHTKDPDLQREPLTQKLTSIIDVHSHIILDLDTVGKVLLSALRLFFPQCGGGGAACEPHHRLHKKTMRSAAGAEESRKKDFPNGIGPWGQSRQWNAALLYPSVAEHIR